MQQSKTRGAIVICERKAIAPLKSYQIKPMSNIEDYTEYKGYFINAEVGTRYDGESSCRIFVKDAEQNDVDLNYWLGDDTPFLWTGFTPCLGAAMAKAEAIVDELTEREQENELP